MSAVAVVDGLVAHGIGSIVLNQLTTIKEDTKLAVQYEGVGGELEAPYTMFTGQATKLLFITIIYYFSGQNDLNIFLPA